MTAWKKLRSFGVFFGVLLLLLMVSGNAAGSNHGGCSSQSGNQCNGVQGQLQLEIVGGIFIHQNPDPWLNESWVTSSSDFQLNISYHRNGASEDVEEIYLIIATNKKPDNVIVKINGSKLDDWEQVNSHKVEVCGYKYPPHGIYNGGNVWYTTYEIEFEDDDKFSPGEHVLVNVNITPKDSVKVHFDAVGCKDSSSSDCEAVVFVPPSHDATYYHSYPIPEFPSIIFPIMLLFGAVLISLRNR
jgi:hypothetical protein